MSAAPAAEAARLVELLTGDAEARQRAYAELESADAAVVQAPAVLDALVDSVLCSAQVESGEYRQACGLMAELMVRRGSSVHVELIREERWVRAWGAPALLAALRKPPAHMTRDDLLTVAAEPTMAVMLARGVSWSFETAAQSEQGMITKFLPAHPLFPEAAAANPGANQMLVELALAICRDPQGLPDVQLALVWNSVWMIITQRPELGAVAANAGIFEIGVAELREFAKSFAQLCPPNSNAVAYR